MAVRRPLRRDGTDLIACSDDDMIRLRYNLRRAYAQMVEGGDTYGVGRTTGKIGTASSIGTQVGSATDNYKTVQYNAGTGRWHYWPTPGSNYGYGPGADYPSIPGTGTTSTTVNLYQDQSWKSSNSGNPSYPDLPSSSDLEHSYLVYDSTDGIVMETNENNIYDTILDDCIAEMHGNNVGSSTGDEIGTYFMTSSSVPNASYLWWTMSDSIVMIDRIHGNSNYATHKLYMKAQHNYVSNGNDGDGPGTEYHLLKEDNGQIVHNPIGIGSDLVNKVLLKYLTRNLECQYQLTSDSSFPSGYSNNGSATDHYYSSSSTSYQGPGTWGGDNYRTYSTPSGNVSAYTTYYLKLFRGV